MDQVFYIEFRDLPHILGHLNETPDTTFDVIDASPGGLNFYFAYPDGDGLLLVPWSNVIAIHCLSPELIRFVRSRKPQG